MWDALAQLSSAMDQFNMAFETSRQWFLIHVADPFDNLPWWIHSAIIYGLVMWFWGNIRIRDFIPHLQEKDLRDPLFMRHTIEFILKEMGIEPNARHHLPHLTLVDSPKDLLLDSSWSWKHEDGVEEAYHGEWGQGRLIILERRIDLWVHGLTHHVQYAYLGVREFSTIHEVQGWDMVRKYMRSSYPVRYWVLMFFFGILGLWDAKLYYYTPLSWF